MILHVFIFVDYYLELTQQWLGLLFYLTLFNIPTPVVPYLDSPTTYNVPQDTTQPILC